MDNENNKNLLLIYILLKNKFELNIDQNCNILIKDIFIVHDKLV